MKSNPTLSLSLFFPPNPTVPLLSLNSLFNPITTTILLHYYYLPRHYPPPAKAAETSGTKLESPSGSPKTSPATTDSYGRPTSTSPTMTTLPPPLLSSNIDAETKVFVEDTPPPPSISPSANKSSSTPSPLPSIAYFSSPPPLLLLKS
ncbi:hypothetical protein CsSME_00039116 [Camellia sinensis var. sinensis]